MKTLSLMGFHGTICLKCEMPYGVRVESKEI